jgi:hypothetical protein
VTRGSFAGTVCDSRATFWHYPGQLTVALQRFVPRSDACRGPLRVVGFMDTQRQARWPVRARPRGNPGVRIGSPVRAVLRAFARYNLVCQGDAGFSRSWSKDQLARYGDGTCSLFEYPKGQAAGPPTIVVVLHHFRVRAFVVEFAL